MTGVVKQVSERSNGMVSERRGRCEVRELPVRNLAQLFCIDTIATVINELVSFTDQVLVSPCPVSVRRITAPLVKDYLTTPTSFLPLVRPIEKVEQINCLNEVAGVKPAVFLEAFCESIRCPILCPLISHQFNRFLFGPLDCLLHHWEVPAFVNVRTARQSV